MKEAEPLIVEPRRRAGVVSRLVDGFGGVAALIVLVLGFRGVEVNAAIALVLLTLVVAAAIQKVLQQPWTRKVRAVWAVGIVAMAVLFWVLTDRTQDGELIRIPYRESVELRISKDRCDECATDFTLDGEGTLFAQKHGAGFVVLGFTESTPYELTDPDPGSVSLPPAGAQQGKGRPAIETTKLTVPPGVTSIKRYSNVLGSYTFELASANRRHLIHTSGRAFEVTLIKAGVSGSRSGEDSVYRFNIVER